MKISIIIPVYNASKTIKKCIESLINQTYKNLEIIIINDGSIDETHKICEEYMERDKRVIYIDNKNHGVSYTRNYGVKKATGDYITFVDSDDYLDLNCYEKLAKHLTPDIEFLRYNFKTIGAKKFDNKLYSLNNKKIKMDTAQKKILFKHFLTYNEPIPNLVMLLLIRRDIALKLEFNEKLTMMEDVDYYLQLFLIANSGYFCDYKLYNYYVNDESVTNNPQNYKKNILGILDTNYCIINSYNDEILKNYIESINENHLRIISNYLIQMYFCNIKKYDNTIMELLNHKEFIRLLNKKNSFKMPLKNRIYLNLLKRNQLSLNKLYLFVLTKLICIKNFIKKH